MVVVVVLRSRRWICLELISREVRRPARTTEANC